MQNVTTKTYKFIKNLEKHKQRNITAAVISLIKQEKPTLFKLNLYKDKYRHIHKLNYEQNSRKMLKDIGLSPYNYATTIVSMFNITKYELVIDRTNCQS